MNLTSAPRSLPAFLTPSQADWLKLLSSILPTSVTSPTRSFLPPAAAGAVVGAAAAVGATCAATVGAAAIAVGAAAATVGTTAAPCVAAAGAPPPPHAVATRLKTPSNTTGIAGGLSRIYALQTGPGRALAKPLAI